MKRLLSIIVSVILLISLCSFSPAPRHYYANSIDSSGYDEYAIDHYDQFIDAAAAGGILSFNVQYNLGEAICIYSDDIYEKVIYPIWSEGSITATLLVIDTEYGYSGSLSTQYSSCLNDIIRRTSISAPLSLVSINDELYGVVNDVWYNMNTSEETEAICSYQSSDSKSIVSVIDNVQLSITPIPTRYPSYYVKSFTIHYQQTGAYCYAYALGNILYNMGYTSYTPSDIVSYMNNASGANKTDLNNYLNSKGLSSTFSNSGYLSDANFIYALYNLNSYIYAGAQKVGYNSYHAFVFFGYYYSNTGDLMGYVWNPWYDYTQTVDMSTKIIPTAGASTYQWNNGYLYNIH